MPNVINSSCIPVIATVLLVISVCNPFVIDNVAYGVSADVDYIISCQTCQMKYLGETSQQFKDRKYQHKKDIEHKNTNNGIYCHLKKNKKHKIAWEQAIFIDRDSHYMRRKIKESIYINALDPSEKPTKIMNLEKGVKIGSCWNEFNSEIRKSLK